jgi:hypothetical protein
MTREEARAMLEKAELYEAIDDEDRRRMIANAVELVGCQVTDSSGRVWIVTEVGTKDGWPTIGGDQAHPFWDRPEAVTQVCPPLEDAEG